MKSDIGNLLYDLLKAANEGLSLDELKELLADSFPPGTDMSGQLRGRLGSLSHLGLAHKQNKRWYALQPGLPEPNGKKPSPESLVAAYISEHGQPVEIPPVRQGWLGVAIVVESDPHPYFNVIKAEYSRDRVHFDPIPLTGDLRFHIGVMTPKWGWEQVTYHHIACLRIEYLDGSTARRDSLDLNGWDLTIARRVDETI